MIEIKKLFYKYPGAKKYALENINLTIESGKYIAILGHIVLYLFACIYTYPIYKTSHKRKEKQLIMKNENKCKAPTTTKSLKKPNAIKDKHYHCKLKHKKK